jgi:hypothetical protein
MKFSIESRQIDSTSDPDLQITITNTSSSVMDVPIVPPRELVTLAVCNSIGTIIMPTHLTPVMGSAGIMYPKRLQPGESYVITNLQLSPWISLSSLGYPNLTPGTYTAGVFAGILLGGSHDPTIATAEMTTDDHNRASKPLSTSNVLTLTI